jgi:xanthine dehydrogenase small subunit
LKRDSIRIIRRGKVVELRDIDPNETLLDYLRLRERACGTKEGCAEGDCGACTVAVGTLHDGHVHYAPVNSCIALLGMLDGKEIVVVDDLASSNDRLHPVQQALVDAHASQCGFCTPGFVMSLFALYHAGIATDRATANDWLAGNLCRCTGYAKIIEAVQAAAQADASR